MNGSVRFVTLDGLRGIAALAVMLHHFTQRTSTPIFAGGNLAVDIFFCLSGFVIAGAYSHRITYSLTVRWFLVTRLIRLYPMYLVGFSVGAVALAMKQLCGQTNLGIHRVAGALVLNVFYIPFFSDFWIRVGNETVHAPIFPVNDAFWSLFFEFFVNVLFGVIVTWKRPKVGLFAAALVGMLGLTAYMKVTWISTPGWGMDNFFGGFPRSCYGFFSGAVVFLVFRKFGKALSPAHPVLLTLLGFSLLLEGWSGYVWFVSTLFAVPLLVLLCAASDPQNALLKKAFDYLGWLSYPLYCVHLPIYSIYTSVTGNRDHGLGTAFGCAAISIAVAHLSCKFIEEPVRTYLKRKAGEGKKAGLVPVAEQHLDVEEVRP